MNLHRCIILSETTITYTYDIKDGDNFVVKSLDLQMPGNIYGVDASDYNSEEEATECYKYEGTITFKGSKKSDDIPLTSIGRCNFGGTWYLVRR